MHEKFKLINTAGEKIWSEEEDLNYYDELHGDDHGELEPQKYLLQQIESNLEEHCVTLDEVFRAFWPRFYKERADIIGLLSLKGKLRLLRDLRPESKIDLPMNERRELISQLDYVLEKYAEAERFRERVLARYIVDPDQVWLRELVDADDKVVAAKMCADDLLRNF